LDQREPQNIGLEARIAAIVEPSLAHMGYELVRIAVLGRDRPTVQIMVDRADGAAVSIDDCELLGRHFNALMNVEDPIPGAWTLEISSPGIDRPLTRVKDWNRFAGHAARAEVVAPIGGRKRFYGIILSADETAARLRLDDGGEIALPLVDIRRAKLVLTEALIEATATPTRTN
jgi:ribosome maturation factor RimP